VVPERCKKPLILAKCRNYRLLFLAKLTIFEVERCDRPILPDMFSTISTKPHVQAECKMGEIAHPFRDNACHALDDHGRIFLGPGFFPVVPERCKKPLILAKCRNYRLLFLATLTKKMSKSSAKGVKLHIHFVITLVTRSTTMAGFFWDRDFFRWCPNGVKNP